MRIHPDKEQLTELRKLERAARVLDPPEALRSQWSAEVMHHANNFLERLPNAPVYRPDPGLVDADKLVPADEADTLDELLHWLDQEVEKAGINPASGGHLGYIPGGGLFPAALGDFLADVSNRYAGVAFASPGAVRLERGLVQWMASLIGLPDGSGGDLTSGGSLANLGAIVTAREAHGLRCATIPDQCIYLTRQAHHCVQRALRVAGLNEAHLRYVPMDRIHRMNVAELVGMIQSDHAAGLKPFMLVASAGTTDTGAVDPLVELGQVAESFGLWFHLDAAYGGFFALCQEGRRTLGGMDRSDSVVMDPHKGLFLPYGSGALLVRDEHQLASAHAYSANYMQDALDEQAYSPADLSAELSRPFRGLRLWLCLKLFGLEPFRAALQEKLLLARYFHTQLSQVDRWEMGPEPDLSVVTYRYCPEYVDADTINRQIMQRVRDDGRVFVSSTQLNGCYTLRLAVLNFRTHLADIDTLLSLLQKFAVELDQPTQEGLQA